MQKMATSYQSEQTLCQKREDWEQGTGEDFGKYKVKNDLAGKRFGDLTALEPTQKRTRHRYVVWMCRCVCGNLTEVARNYLTTGNTKSCGCRKRENNQRVYQNLHFVDGTCVEFVQSRKKRADNKTGHIGVSGFGNRYRANITFRGKRYYLGTFETIEEAATARKKAEARLYAPFLEKYYRQAQTESE